MFHRGIYTLLALSIRIALFAGSELPAPGTATGSIKQTPGSSSPPGLSKCLGTKKFRNSESGLTIEFSRDGRSIVTGSNDGVIRVWDAATGAAKARLTAPRQGPAGSLLSVAVSPSGAQLAFGTEMGVWLWDWPTHRDPRLFARSDPIWIDKVPSTFFSGNVCVAFSPKGNLLAWVTSQGKLYLKDVKASTVLLATQPLPWWSLFVPTKFQVAFSPDGSLLAFSDGSGQIRLWQLEGFKDLDSVYAIRGSVDCVMFSPDSKYLAFHTSRQDLVVWDLRAKKPREQLHLGAEGFTAMVFCPDGKDLLLADGKGVISSLSLSTGVKTRRLQGAYPNMLSMTISADGKLLAAIGEYEAIRVWNMNTGREVFSGAGQLGRIRCLSLSPDNRVLATGSHDGTIFLWDSTEGRFLKSLEGHTDKVQAVAYSPDGSMIASGGNDGSARLWDRRSGRLVGHPPSFDG